MPREGETPESNKWDELGEQKFSGGKGRKPIPQEATAEIMGGPPRDFDPFELAPHTAKKFGMNLETETYTWIQNPAVWEEHTGVNRVDEIEAHYEGAEVVLRPGSQEPVKRSDTILVKMPIRHLHEKQRAERDRMTSYIAMNPAESINKGMRYEDVMEIIETHGSQELITARREHFEFGDIEKTKMLAARARHQSDQARKTSPTYGQSYELAYENQIYEIQAMNPRLTKGQSEAELHKEIEAMETRALMGATMDAGQSNWADDIDRSAKRSIGMFNIGANIGRSTEEIVRERHGRNNRPATGGGR